MGLSKGFKGILRPKALETAFSKTLLGRMQSLSTHPDLATLPDGRATGYSFLAQGWALCLRFLAWFMGISGLFDGLFQGVRRASEP